MSPGFGTEHRYPSSFEPACHCPSELVAWISGQRLANKDEDPKGGKPWTGFHDVSTERPWTGFYPEAPDTGGELSDNARRTTYGPLRRRGLPGVQIPSALEGSIAARRSESVRKRRGRPRSKSDTEPNFELRQIIDAAKAKVSTTDKEIAHKAGVSLPTLYRIKREACASNYQKDLSIRRACLKLVDCVIDDSDLEDTARIIKIIKGAKIQ